MKPRHKIPSHSEIDAVCQEKIFPVLKEIIHDYEWSDIGLASTLFGSAYSLLRNQYDKDQAREILGQLLVRQEEKIQRPMTSKKIQ